MEKTFYIRIPGESYYENPLSKDSICFLFNLEEKTIVVTKRVQKDGEFVSKSKSFSISREWFSVIEKTLEGEKRFLQEYLERYEPADGQRFVHSVFSLGKEKVLFPDYLTNFGNNDIFSLSLKYLISL